MASQGATSGLQVSVAAAFLGAHEAAASENLKVQQAHLEATKQQAGAKKGGNACLLNIDQSYDLVKLDTKTIMSSESQDPARLDTKTVQGCCAQQCDVATKNKISEQFTNAPQSLPCHEFDWSDADAARLGSSPHPTTHAEANSLEAMPPTPQASTLSSITTPPGAPACGRASPLFHALRRGSLKQVKLALEYEHGAAVFPLIEALFEPPLCCSVRLGCSEQVVRLLLQHAASVDAENVERQTPLMLLSSEPSNSPHICSSFAESAGRSKRQWSVNVAKLLIDAEADPMSSDRGTPSCLELASQAQNAHLVRLYRREPDADVPANNEVQGRFPSFAEFLVDAEGAFRQPWIIPEPPAMR